MLIAHAPLKPQTQSILRLLVERGSLTQREAVELAGCWRLSARVGEIREAFGVEVIATEHVHHDGGTHARYWWQGDAEAQRSLAL